MKRPQLISSGSLRRMMHDASEAWNRGEHQQCYELLERASRLDSANYHILFNLGQRYGLRYRFSDAERCLQKAVRIAPNRPEALATAARLAAEFSHHSLAEQFYKESLKQSNVTAETIARLAELYDRMHRAEDATLLVERALHLDRTCSLARLIQATLYRQAGKLAEAEQALQDTLTRGSRELRVRSYYELGTIRDRQGEYDAAMSAFIEAKSLLRPDAPPILAQLQRIIAQLNEMQATITGNLLARWHETGLEQLQPLRSLAFLGGHARSGTTLLEQVLDAHPDITSAEETTIFHNDAYATLRRSLPETTSLLTGLINTTNETLLSARERYFQTMRTYLGELPNGRLLVDKNPSLQALIITFIRIFPEAKLIIALRDPRDVVLSCYMLPHWLIGTGNVTFLDLEGTVQTYTRAMGIWKTLKPLIKNPWLEVHYEDIVDNLESVAYKTLDFLAKPRNDTVLHFDKHAQKKLVRSPTYADVAQPVYKRSKGRWRNYQKYLEPYLDKLAPFTNAFGYE